MLHSFSLLTTGLALDMETIEIKSNSTEKLVQKQESQLVALKIAAENLKKENDGEHSKTQNSILKQFCTQWWHTVHCAVLQYFYHTKLLFIQPSSLSFQTKPMDLRPLTWDVKRLRVSWGNNWMKCQSWRPGWRIWKLRMQVRSQIFINDR